MNIFCDNTPKHFFIVKVSLWESDLLQDDPMSMERVAVGHKNLSLKLYGADNGDIGDYFEPYLRIVHNCQAPYQITKYYLSDCAVEAETCFYNETIILG